MNKPRKLKERVDIWAEGEYVDLWTIVHFIAGLLLGFGPIILPWPFEYVLSVAIGLIILWEVYEHVMSIHETFGNRVVDIIVGVGGLFATVAAYPILTPLVSWIGGLSLLLLYILMCISGWRAYLQRKKNNFSVSGR